MEAEEGRGMERKGGEWGGRDEWAEEMNGRKGREGWERRGEWEENKRGC